MSRQKGQKDHEIRKRDTIHINARFDVRNLAQILLWLEKQNIAIHTKSELTYEAFQVLGNSSGIPRMSLAEATRILTNRNIINVDNAQDNRVIVCNLAVESQQIGEADAGVIKVRRKSQS